MNDFLQSLRNGQAEKQRTPKTRKNYDNSYHYTSQPRYNSYGGYANTRNQQMKRAPIPQPPGNQYTVDEGTAATTMLADAIENLSAHIETLVKNQEYLLNAQEKTADMMERQALAIERILDHLNIGNGQEDIVEPEDIRPAEQAFEAPVAGSIESATDQPVIRKRKRKKIITREKPEQKSTGLLSREEVMEIIHNMRAEGATFEQVANHLIELGQPTFSGRGEWHAQTIHRLCNKK
jgi:hypothetical protein